MHPVLFGSLGKGSAHEELDHCWKFNYYKVRQKIGTCSTEKQTTALEENYLHLYCPKISDLSLIFCPYQWAYKVYSL